MSFFTKKASRQIAAYQRELIETHFAEVDNMYRQMRGWRHDYRNHIQAMKVYAAAGDMDAIRSYMDMKNTQLYISFTNFTATSKQPRLGRRFGTTKGEGHGLGLIRIDDIVDRLDGYVNRGSEDGAFTTEILLPQ